MAKISAISIELLTFFVVTCLSLVTLFFYVIWRRKKLQNRLASSVPPSEFSNEPPCKSPSKELLYFLWLTGPTGPSFQVEPAAVDELNIDDSEVGSPRPPPPLPEEYFQQSCDSGRVTYRIDTDEEGEEGQFDGDTSFRFAEVMPEVGGGEGEVGFFTPCSSPQFSSPMSSPPREVDGLSASEEVDHREDLVLQVMDDEQMNVPDYYRLSFSVDNLV